jgi:tetratricopeptide (TPR) repeat protein
LLTLVVALLFGAANGCSMVAHQQNAAGVKLYQQGYYAQALQNFQKASTTDPKDADALYNQAATYHRLGKLNNRKEDLTQAESLYNQSLDHDANNKDCYRALAVLLVDENRNDEAQRLLQGWATRSPTSAAPKVEMARLAEDLGDKQSAKTYLTEALAINPYEPRALAALGRINEESGNMQQALVDYERSLQYDRFQPELASRVATLKTAMGPMAPNVTPPGGSRVVTTPTVAPRY